MHVKVILSYFHFIKDRAGTLSMSICTLEHYWNSVGGHLASELTPEKRRMYEYSDKSNSKTLSPSTF